MQRFPITPPSLPPLCTVVVVRTKSIGLAAAAAAAVVAARERGIPGNERKAGLSPTFESFHRGTPKRKDVLLYCPENPRRKRVVAPLKVSSKMNSAGSSVMERASSEESDVAVVVEDVKQKMNKKRSRNDTDEFLRTGDFKFER